MTGSAPRPVSLRAIPARLHEGLSARAVDQGPRRSAAEVSRGQGAPGIPEGSRSRPFSILWSLVNVGVMRPRATKSLRAAASAGPTVLLASERPSDWERGAPGAPSEPRAGERRAARQRLRRLRLTGRDIPTINQWVRDRAEMNS